jgi:tetratricopeptide (TPR) repeat protein
VGGTSPRAYDAFQSELAQARAIDPGNPLALSLSPQRDARLAVAEHPDDWRSWVLWFDDHDRDAAAIHKAAALAPDNPGVLIRLAYAEQDEGRTKEAVEHAERARALHPAPYVLTALAWIYDRSGRCKDAVATQRRAIDALSDGVSPERPVEYRKRLIEMESHCAQSGARRTVEAEPVLKLCRQPLKQGSTAGVSAHFTVREDGSVTAVAIQGAASDLSGELRDFVESCSFEPVLVEGKPRQVQIDLKLDDLLQ